MEPQIEAPYLSGNLEVLDDSVKTLDSFKGVGFDRKESSILVTYYGNITRDMYNTKAMIYKVEIQKMMDFILLTLLAPKLYL